MSGNQCEDARTQILVSGDPWRLHALGPAVSLLIVKVPPTYGPRMPLQLGRVVFVDHDEGAPVPEGAAVELQADDAQALMDGLWRQGIRPTEAAGSAGQLAATTKHLDDMRRLVFQVNTAIMPPDLVGKGAATVGR